MKSKVKKTGYELQDTLVEWCMEISGNRINWISREIGLNLTRTWKIIACGYLMNVKEISKFKSMIDAWT